MAPTNGLSLFQSELEFDIRINTNTSSRGEGKVFRVNWVSYAQKGHYHIDRIGMLCLGLLQFFCFLLFYVHSKLQSRAGRHDHHQSPAQASKVCAGTPKKLLARKAE